MAEKSSFFNSINHDRVYQAGDFADFFSPLVKNGFFSSLTNLQATANGTNMDVTIAAGRAWINGYQYVNTSNLTLEHDISDGILKRIDRIVVRLSFIDRNITTVIKKGVPAQNPTPPALQRDNDIYELGVATVSIDAGAINIKQTDIIDTRDDVTVGGIVNNIMAQANAQSRTTSLDDLNNYFVSDNVEGALIELTQPLTIEKTNQDPSGIFMNVKFFNSAGVAVKESILSNKDANGNFLRRTLNLFGQDGTTVMKTTVFTRTYNANGEYISEEITI